MDDFGGVVRVADEREDEMELCSWWECVGVWVDVQDGSLSLGLPSSGNGEEDSVRLFPCWWATLLGEEMKAEFSIRCALVD